MFFIWTGSKDQLITFLNDLNTRHNSIKFEYKISQSCIPFLDMEVYIINNKPYTKIYRKERDRRNFLHINSEHPVSLKNSVPYGQVSRPKCTYSTIENFKLYCSELKQISTVKKLDRNEMLKKKVKEKLKQTCISIILT